MSAGTLLGTRARKVLVAAGPALALYALGGFVIAPVLLRGPMERRVGALLGRPVALERLRLNPFAMSLTVDGFLISDPDGTPLLRWERLYVDFAPLRSLLRREWTFGEIRLIGAAGRLALLRGGALDVDDIIKRLQAAEGTRVDEPPVITIQRLRLEDSSLAFVDRSGDLTFTTTLGPLRLDLRDFTTRRDELNAYSFRGRTEAGETFSWAGDFSLEPLRSE